MYSRFSSLLILVFAVSACTPKTGDPHNIHEGSSEPTRSLREDDSKGSSTVVNAYSTEVLDDPYKTSNLNQTKELSSANSRMLQDENFFESNKQAFENAVFSGCDQNLSSCKAIQYFRSDHLSFKVLHKICLSKNELAEKYRCLGLAWDLKNSKWDTDLARTYVEQARDYFKILAQKNDKEARTRHRRILGLIIDNQSVNKDSIVVEKLLGQFQAAEASLLDHNELGDHIFKLLKLGSGRLERKPRSQLLADINKFKSYQASGNLVNLRLSDISSSFGLLLDEVFNGHLTPNDAAQEFSNKRNDPKELADIWQSYLQFRFFHELKRSNLFMSGKFKQFEENASSEMIEIAISGSFQERSRWQEFTVRAGRMMDFAVTLIGKDTQGSLQLDRIRSYFLALPRNIKYAVAYPHILSMAYKLSKVGFKQTIYLRYSQGSLDAKTIFSKIFTGEWSSQLMYSSDEAKLNPYEILTAIQLGIENGSFDDFGVPIGELLQRMFDEVFTDKIQVLTVSNDNLYSRSEKRIGWQSIKNLCSAIKGNLAANNQVLAEDALNSPLLGKNYKFLVSNDEHTIDIGAMPYSVPLEDGLEQVRIHFAPLLTRFDLLIGYLESREQKTNLESLKKQMQSFRSYQDDFLKRYLTYSKEYRNCFFELFKADTDLKAEIIKAEELFLRSVHRDMQQLQKNPDLKEQLNAKYGFVAFSGSSQRFNENFFSYQQMDLLSRLQAYSGHGYQAGDLTIRPITKLVQIRMPKNLSETRMFVNPQFFTISYSDSVDDFIRSALKGLLGMTTGGAVPVVNWFRNPFLGSTKFRYWINHFALSHRILSTNSQLAKEVDWSLDESIDKILLLYDSVSFQPQLFDFHKKAGTVSILDYYDLDFLIELGRPIPFLKYFYLWLYEDYVGWFASLPINYDTSESNNKPRERYYALSKQIRDLSTMKRVGLPFLIPPTPGLQQAAERILANELRVQVGLMKDVGEKIEARYQADLRAGKNFKLHIVFRKELNMPYLTPESEQNYRGFMENLKRDTGGFSEYLLKEVH